MRLTPYGRAQWLGAGLVLLPLAVWAFVAGHLWLTLLCFVLLIAFAGFFRDPVRVLPDDADLWVAPADGHITHIETVTGTPETEALGCETAHRISIFLSVFDVHVSRVPCAMRVTGTERREGQCLDARREDSSQRNAAVTLSGVTVNAKGAELPLLVRQITGLVARRIVCDVPEGTHLERGETYGMIKFGSRTEVYFPVGVGVEPVGAIGDRVLGRSTSIARMKRSI